MGGVTTGGMMIGVVMIGVVMIGVVTIGVVTIGGSHGVTGVPTGGVVTTGGSHGVVTRRCVKDLSETSAPQGICDAASPRATPHPGWDPAAQVQRRSFGKEKPRIPTFGALA